jgi:hypothetical protein
VWEVVLASFCRAFAFGLVLRVGACDIRVLYLGCTEDELSGGHARQARDDGASCPEFLLALTPADRGPGWQTRQSDLP